MKHTITIHNNYPTPQYKGFDIFTVKKGTIVKLIEKVNVNIPDHTPFFNPLMVTGDPIHPLIDLTNGCLFGCNIENYIFEKMPVTELKFILN